MKKNEVQKTENKHMSSHTVGKILKCHSTKIADENRVVHLLLGTYDYTILTEPLNTDHSDSVIWFDVTYYKKAFSMSIQPLGIKTTLGRKLSC